MEASEKPQLQIGDEPDGTVRALGDRIVIEALTVDDRRAAEVVRDRAQAGSLPSETVRKAIEIGARVLDSEETAVNVDYVRREIEASLGELDEKLEGTLTASAESISESLAEVFEGDESLLAQVRETIAKNTHETLQAMSQVLTAEDSTNPLVAVQKQLGKAMLEAEERSRAEVERLRDSHSKEARAMQGQVAELRKELARLLERDDADDRVAEAEEAGTRKGISFEEKVFAAIEQIASIRNDCAMHTGGEGAEGGGKKGDVLVELGAAEGPSAGRIVFECKDKQLSKRAAWDELNAAMASRAASFGVLVVAGDDRVPAGREQLREYEGNKLIVSVDREDPDDLPLALAYRLAAARVTMARDRDLTVDAAEVRSVTEEALSCLQQAQAIKSALTGIKTSSDRARSGLDEMIATLQVKLDRIDSLVAEAADEAEQD
ncbi:MAG: hypothetical protein QOI31_2861 [Solirubrobacterales bacterium]|jgi:hypothetical protein|nr:hypothetical protein [Solirubrobacterales bacterium]